MPRLIDRKAPGQPLRLNDQCRATLAQMIDHCCDAWNKLLDQPWTIMSIGLRDWAYG